MLDRFTELLKSQQDVLLQPTHLIKVYIGEFGDAITKRLHHQYIESMFDSTFLRPSCLGKIHPFDLLYSKFQTLPPSSASEKSKLIFSLGDWFECWVGLTLKRLGYRVEEDVEFTWQGIKGHTDLIVTDDDGQDYVLEIKTANSRYFNQVRDNGVTDERGYLSQLLIYSSAMRLPGYWLFVNKDNMDMMLIALNEVCPDELRKSKILSYGRLAMQYAFIEDILDIYDMYSPPPPGLERDRYQEPKVPHRCYVPAYAHYPNVYYQIKEGRTEYGAKRQYVTGMKYPELINQYMTYEQMCAYSIEYWGDRMNENWLIKKHYQEHGTTKPTVPQ